MRDVLRQTSVIEERRIQSERERLEALVQEERERQQAAAEAERQRMEAASVNGEPAGVAEGPRPSFP